MSVHHVLTPVRRLSGRGRRLTVLAAMLTAVLAVLAPIAPAHASGVNCVTKHTPYKWFQASCLEWAPEPPYPTGLWGYGEVTLEQGFTRANVKTCTGYLQLTSSYGSKSPAVSFDCTGQARAGGSFTFPDQRYYYPSSWGFGRYCGDTYYQYAWIDIASYSGTTYYGQPYAAKTSVVKCS